MTLIEIVTGLVVTGWVFAVLLLVAWIMGRSGK